MAVRIDGSSRAFASWWFAVVLGTGVLVALAIRAGVSAPDAGAGFVVLDVSVGIAFVAAGSLVRGPATERALVIGVGLTWLAASVWPLVGSVHQAVLATALIGFPSGRIRSSIAWLLTAAAVAVALAAVPQPGVAALFASVAGWKVIDGRSRGGGNAYPAASATAVAAAIALSWVTHQFDVGALDPTLALVVYEVVLLAVAATFPAAVRAVVRARGRLADEVVSDMTLGGVEGLAIALRAALGDPSLSVYRWHPSAAAYVDGEGRRVDRPIEGRRWLPVVDPDGPVAAVAHRSDRLDDAPTAAAIASAVRLTVTNLRLREELAERLHELEASRSRILAAADLARGRFAEELRDDVEASLRVARSELSSLAVADREASAALDIVVDELDGTSATIADLVMGVPPANLGGGRLGLALGDLVGRSPIPVSLTLDEDASGTADVEATVYYLVAEAVTNAVKHAGATHVAIQVHRRDDMIVASITDDGRGGADPSGSGLQGLTDRLAVRGGRLRVESPPGAGTRLVATVPV